MKLAIIITSYNRHDNLIAFTKRIKQSLLSHAKYYQSIHLFIINNGEPIPLKSTSSVSIITNQNLGGSGGFARGLYEASKDPSITHCLFMDDDAGCDINSLVKTMSLLESSENPHLAIAGTMITQDAPDVIYEAGASCYLFGMVNRSRFKGLPLNALTRARNLLERPIDYGGWWFYVFPVKNTPYYPFPFFIRGDDILFGLMNPHQIDTSPHILSKQPDFDTKFCPFVNYLAARNRFIIGAYTAPIRASIFLRLFFLHQVIYFTFCYRYESARAVIEGFKDGLKGSQFWVDNIECIEPRERIAKLTINEEYQYSIEDLTNYSIDSIKTVKDRPFKKAIRALTFNSHLLPRAFFKKSTRVTSGRFKYPTRHAFLQKQIIYESPNNDKLMLLKHSKKDCFKILGSACWLLFKTSFSLHQVLQQYRKDIPYLTSESFWERQFSKSEGFVKKRQR